MSKSDAFENLLIRHIFLNEAIPNIGNAGGLLSSSAAGSLYFSLHSADPGEAGDQTTNEVGYTSYARAAVARSTTGFVVTGPTVKLMSPLDFPEMTGGSNVTATFFGVGTALSGAGLLLYSGPMSPTVAIALGVTPRLKATTSITED